MSKMVVVIILVILAILAGFGYYFYNKKQINTWNDKCRTSGGRVIKSGEICDYLNCDHSKYSCSMYS